MTKNPPPRPSKARRQPRLIFEPQRPSDVAGCLRYDGPPKTIAKMDAAVAEEARRRKAVQECLIAGEQSGAPKPFDFDKFTAQMRKGCRPSTQP